MLYKVEKRGVPVKVETIEEDGFTRYSFETHDVAAVISEPDMPASLTVAVIFD